MTRINFYIIESGTDEAIQSFICRLTEKAYSQTNTVYIQALDQQHALNLDELLWSFNDKSFIPHQLADEQKDHSKVLIGYQAESEVPADHHDVLINFNHATPTFFSQFERVAEIVASDEVSREKGRERYRFYKDRGYALETHKMSL